MTDFHPGGIITAPDGADSTQVTLAPDECVLVWEADGAHCRRPGHGHGPAPVISRADGVKALDDVLRFITNVIGVEHDPDAAASIIASLTE